MRVLRSTLLVLLIIVSFGTVGYMIVENWGVLDAVYMTLITLTTTGFGEVHELSQGGKIFTIVLILFGLGTVAAVWSNATRFITEGSLRSVLGRKKLEKMIQKMREHYIICGHGRMGSLIASELAKNRTPHLILEKNEDVVSKLIEEGHLALTGDATSDTRLEECGIKHARGLVSVLSSDADNVFVTLSARGMNPNLFIVSRADDERSAYKLKQAGADRVVLPYHIGGMKIAQAILRPSILEFIDHVGGGPAQDLMLDEIPVPAASPYIDLSLIESNIRQQLGVIILAIKSASGEMLINPRPDHIIREGDVMICLGSRERLEKLEERGV